MYRMIRLRYHIPYEALCSLLRCDRHVCLPCARPPRGHVAESPVNPLLTLHGHPTPAYSKKLLRDKTKKTKLHGLSPQANYTDRLSDRRLSAKLMPTLADRGYRVVSATIPPQSTYINSLYTTVYFSDIWNGSLCIILFAFHSLELFTCS
jgi:hypothetical protein